MDERPYRKCELAFTVYQWITERDKPWLPSDIIDFTRPIFALMNDCLEFEAHLRPSIDEVVARLDGML
jgi:hypothetical protein